MHAFVYYRVSNRTNERAALHTNAQAHRDNYLLLYYFYTMKLFNRFLFSLVPSYICTYACVYVLFDGVHINFGIAKKKNYIAMLCTFACASVCYIYSIVKEESGMEHIDRLYLPRLVARPFVSHPQPAKTMCTMSI